jgi:protein ImuB
VVGHRLASGLDPRPLDARRPAPEHTVSREVEPPAEQIDRAAFVAKALADELHARLATDGLACTHVLVEAETEHGETLARHWRHEGALTAGSLADRVRWQLDGWLTGSARTRPTAGISRITLVPVEVVAARGRQLGFWGGETLVDERVLRAVARVQGMLGPDAVTVPEVRGGRGPAERVARVPVAAVDLTAPRPAARPTSVGEPWPGRVPAPAPASVAVGPEPVDVVDAEGRPVGVTGRAEVTAPPVRLTRPGRPPVAVTAWAGPWPVDERWWDPLRHRRLARFQLLDAGGTAHLLAVESGRWWLEATYD